MREQTTQLNPQHNVNNILPMNIPTVAFEKPTLMQNMPLPPTTHYQFEKNKQIICIVCHQFVDPVAYKGQCQVCLKRESFYQQNFNSGKKTKETNNKRKRYRDEGYKKALSETQS